MMSDGGSLPFSVLAPPAEPKFFGKAGRAAWELMYPQMLARYYGLCEQYREDVRLYGDVLRSDVRSVVPETLALCGVIPEGGLGRGRGNDRVSVGAPAVGSGVADGGEVPGEAFVEKGSRCGFCSRDGKDNVFGTAPSVDALSVDGDKESRDKRSVGSVGGSEKGADGLPERKEGCGGAFSVPFLGCSEGDDLSGVVKPGVGPNGGVSYGRRGNYHRNQDARDRKKRALRRSATVDSPVVERTDLQKSSESKWQAQNRLAALKAEREIAILEATDLDEEKRKRRAQICASTERNLVSIERFHSDLRKSGNSSSDDDTRVNTVLSAGAGSISPGSSVSEADIRKAKKDLEDAIEREKKLSAALIRMGQCPEAIIGYGSAEVDIDAKTEWTVDSKDRITGDNEAILDIVYPDGYLVIHDDIDFVHPDGKRKVRLVGGPRYSMAEPVVDEIDYDAKSHWSLGSRNAIPDEMAAKLFEKFPNGYKENYDSYSDAVTGKPRGIIRPTALPPRVS